MQPRRHNATAKTRRHEEGLFFFVVSWFRGFVVSWSHFGRSAKALEGVNKSRTTQKPRNPQRKMLKVFLRVLRVLRSTSNFFTSSKAVALRSRGTVSRSWTLLRDGFPRLRSATLSSTS